MAFDPSGAVPVEPAKDAATPGFAFDTAGAEPVRKVGTVEAALRTMGAATQKAVRYFDMVQAGILSTLDFMGPTGRTALTGEVTNDARAKQDTQAIENMRNETFRSVDEHQASMSDMYAPKPNEEFGLGGKLLGAAGSIPVAAVSAGGPALIEKAMQVIDRGGSMKQAVSAGAVAGGVDAATALVPAAAGLKTAARAGEAGIGAVGSVARGAVSGAAVNAGAGALGRAANNAALPEGEQYKDLQQAALDPEAIAMDAVMAAGFGAAAGKGGHAQGKTRAKAKADAAPPPFPEAKMQDAGDGNYRAPNGATITKEQWESSSPRVRDGWMKEKPVEESVPVGEAKEISVDEAVAKSNNAPDTADLDRVIKENPDGPVAKVALAERAKRLEDAVKAEAKAKDRTDANELRRAAAENTDEGFKARLLKEADKLDPPAKIPAGETKEGQPEIKTEEPKKPIPVGEVKEGQPEIDTGPAETIPVGEVKAEYPEGHTPVLHEDSAPPEPIPAGEARELYVDPNREGGPIPVGEAKEVETLPVGETKEGQPEIDTGPAEKIPVGEAIEGEPIPVGEAHEQIPVGEAHEVHGVTPTEPAPEKIPVGKTKELYIPPEKKNGSQKITKQEGVRQERGNGNESGQTAEASAGDRVRREEQGVKKGEGKDELADLGLPKLDEDFVEHQLRSHAEKETPETLKRGRRHVRAEIEKGIADGTISKDGGELALRVLDKNPNLARGLRVERPVREQGDIARGLYETADRVVKLFQHQGDVKTVVHEILHHIERMMPPEIQRGIRREWKRALDAELAKAAPEQRKALESIRDSLNGGRAAFERMKDAFADGTLDRDKHYYLTNPSEFWAVKATDILYSKHAGRNSWRVDAKRWLLDTIEHVKGMVGLRSDAPILKALDHVLNPERTTGIDRSPNTLKSAEARAQIADSERLATIGGPKSPQLPEETKNDIRKRKIFDSQRRTEQAQEVTGITDEDADMRLAARLNLGRVQKRTEDFEHDVKRPLEKALAEAKTAGITVRDADDYLTALHASERNAVIKQRDPKNDSGSGYTDQQAQDIIDSFTPGQRKHLDKIADMVHKMNRDKLDSMVEDGLITPETRDSLNAQFKNYVPLKTLEEEANFTGSGRGYQTWANDIQSATGRTTRAGSPIAASIMDATRAITRGERARVNKVIWNFANHADSGDIVKVYDPANPPAMVMKAELDKNGQRQMVIDRRKLEDHTIPLVVDGHQQRVFVKDPALKEALATAGTPQQLGDITRAISKGMRNFTRTLTEWNVAFAPVNMVKDVGTAILRAKRLGIDATAFTPDKLVRAQAAVVAHLAGKRTGDAATYDEMLNAGGKTGGYGLTSLADTMASLEKTGADLGYDDHKGGIGRKIGKVAGAIGEGLSKYNEVFEYGTRFVAYQAAREKGMTPKRAAEVARKITVDFNVSGDIGRRLGHVYAFANAALQGLHGDVKDLKSTKTRYRMLSLIGLGAAAQAYNETFGGVNEETGDKNVDSQSDSSLDNNLTMLSPDSRKGLKIPLPPGLATGLYTMGRRLWRLGSEGNVEREATGVMSAATQSVMPVRFAEGANQVTNVLQGLTPALIRPAADIIVNSNQFGVPIVPQSRDTKSPPPAYTLSRNNTSEIAKSASKFLNDLTGGDEIKPGASQKYLGNFVAPEALEYLTGYYTGGVGQLAMQSKNIVKNAAEGKPQDVNKIPVARRFAFTEPLSYTSRRYHELQSEYEVSKKYDKAGKTDKIPPVIQRTMDDYTAADKELSALFKSLSEASADADREPIQQQIKTVQSSLIKAYNQARNEQPRP